MSETKCQPQLPAVKPGGKFSILSWEISQQSFQTPMSIIVVSKSLRYFKIINEIMPHLVPRFVGGNTSGDGRRRRIAMPHSLAVYREYGNEAGVEKHLVARLV